MSIVCCDLRGFTNYAREHSSNKVISVLRKYYDCVGEAVTEYEGTVKDYAGDGVLVLIGAPLRLDDHAQRAVALAESIVLRWQDGTHPLDVGVDATHPALCGRCVVNVDGAGESRQWA